MNNARNSYDKVITSGDIDRDFEYNFDLNPFTYLIDGLLFLVALPYDMLLRLARNVSGRLQKTQEEQALRRTFKGPACMLK